MPGSKISVMVVEDIEEMRALIGQVLEGCESVAVTSQAVNGAEARLYLTRRRPQVVLLDEILPGESSVDLLNELVSEGIAVILMTGLGDPTHGLPAGAFSRIAKPGWKSLEKDRARIVAEILRAASASRASA